MKIIRDKIIMVEDFLTPKECQEYIDFSKSNGFTPATINTRQGHKVIEDIRNNYRFSYDSDELSQKLFDKIKPHLAKVPKNANLYGLNNRIHFFRYEVGQKYNWHFDGAYSPDANTVSYMTFFVYLNDDFEGGGTSFILEDAYSKDEFTIEPKAGTALCFYQQYKHRGDEVTKGVKYAMRSDVLYRFE